MQITRRDFLSAGGMAAAGTVIGKPTRSSIGVRKLAELDEEQEQYTAASYIQNGLIAMWDAIENVGWGYHDAMTPKWKDLSGNNDIELVNGFWTDDSFICNGSTQGIIENSIADVGTIEIIVKTTRSGVAQLVFNSIVNYYQQGFSYRANGTVNFRDQGPCYRASMPTERSSYACTYSKPNTLYENGERRDSLGSGANFAVSGAGISRRGQYMFFGEICGIRLFNRLLSPEEIAYNYMIDKARFNLP